MFCPNCKTELEAVDNEKLLTQSLQGGDYWTHQCPECKTYWHLHLAGTEVVLMATKSDQPASVRIKDGLKTELSKRIEKL